MLKISKIATRWKIGHFQSFKKNTLNAQNILKITPELLQNLNLMIKFFQGNWMINYTENKAEKEAHWERLESDLSTSGFHFQSTRSGRWRWRQETQHQHLKGQEEEGGGCWMFHKDSQKLAWRKKWPPPGHQQSDRISSSSYRPIKRHHNAATTRHKSEESKMALGRPSQCLIKAEHRM